LADDAQLGLFAPTSERRTRAVKDPSVVELAARLPSHVRLGTSSWTFSGWEGLVYEGDTRLAALTRDGLAAYAEHPLFRTVGVDRSYYAPLSVTDLEEYARALPGGFETISKVWEEVTTFVFPDHPRYGAKRGLKNPHFFDASIVTDEVLPAYASFPHAGPFLFELAPVRGLTEGEAATILVKLDELLDALPSTYRYSFEIRSPRLLCARYLDVLRAHGAGHVVSSWSGMPSVEEQLRLPGVLTAPFVVARLTLPPGLAYESAKARFAPFHRIALPQPGVRRAMQGLSGECEASGKSLSILVGNKIEGSAPLTVRALAEALAR
jgi:uncharacterized protein YecE (DUF72 family)